MKECSVLLETASLPKYHWPPYSSKIPDWKEVFILQVKSRPLLYTPNVPESVRNQLWDEVTEAMINAGYDMLPSQVGSERTG